MSRANRERFILSVVNYKGGSGKTTSAVYFAHALHERGRRVVLVDADPQGSAVEWGNDAPDPFPFPVLGLPVRDLHRQLPDLLRSDIDAVVIDTPPLQDGTGIVTNALRISTVAVVAAAPTPVEYKRLAKMVETATDAAGFRADGEPVPLAVLLTRTHPTASSTAVYRDQIRADGVHCLNADVRRLERFAQAYGDNVTGANITAYGDALDELMAKVGEERA